MPAAKKSGSSKRMTVMTRIVDSARREIEKNGILGLRVADVAAGAESSITQIYRYFGDRDGLLAQVLGDIYEEGLHDSLTTFSTRMRNLEVITIDDLVMNLPAPSRYATMKSQDVQLQILATSVMNPQLRERIENVSRGMLPKWEAELAHVEARIEPGVGFDRRVFTIMLLLQTMYHRTILGDQGFTDEEYRQFLRDKMALPSD